MLEGILYFALGFLGATFLALMISPMIWRRAVVLTKRRIESSVPLTLNEIQADKDRLRAEFAMSTRRLERSVEELKQRANEQVIEINTKRDELIKLGEETSEKISLIEELEGRSSETRSELQDRERRVDQLNVERKSLEEKLEQLALELETNERRLGEAEATSDGKRIELVARESEISNLTDKLKSEHDQIIKRRRSEEDLKAELVRETRRAENEASKAVELNEYMLKSQRRIADLEEKLERRQKEMTERRRADADAERGNSGVEAKLTGAQTRILALEAELAETNLRTEVLLNDASNENVKEAMQSLNNEKDRLRSDLETITNERDEFANTIDTFKRSNGEDWETERQENAILRERINDLAAEVTAMTATLEGEGSPINKILDAAKMPTRRSASSLLARITRTATGGDAEPANDDKQQSLADRIRALQESARKVESG